LSTAKSQLQTKSSTQRSYLTVDAYLLEFMAIEEDSDAKSEVCLVCYGGGLPGRL
jgi:hypothetical protein